MNQKSGYIETEDGWLSNFFLLIKHSLEKDIFPEKSLGSDSLPRSHPQMDGDFMKFFFFSKIEIVFFERSNNQTPLSFSKKYHDFSDPLSKDWKFKESNEIEAPSSINSTLLIDIFSLISRKM